MVLFSSPLKSNPKLEPKSYPQFKSYPPPEENSTQWMQAGGGLGFLKAPYQEGQEFWDL